MGGCRRNHSAHGGSPRNRAADDLFCVLESWPGLADNRKRLERLPIPRPRLIALTTDHLPLRALALRMIFADRRLDLPRRGSPDIGFDVLDELGVAPTTLAITREGYRAPRSRCRAGNPL